jgi:hypothetical protein
MKFNVERLVKIPMIDNVDKYVENGCGCAFGVAYMAMHPDVEFNSPRLTEKILYWRNEIKHSDSSLHNILDGLEDQMFNASRLKFTPINDDLSSVTLERTLSDDQKIKFKKLLLEALIEHGYIKTQELEVQNELTSVS